MKLFKLGTWLSPFREPERFEGPGSALQLCEVIALLGARRILLVTDRTLVRLGLVAPLEAALRKRGVAVARFDDVEPDPTLTLVEAGHARYQHAGCDAVLAVGGGSAIDLAKLVAARATNDVRVAQMTGLFRVRRRAAPLYAVPTTAGTGSEVTIVAVVTDPVRRRKLTALDFKLLPRAVALDPTLMTGLPAHITAATGMDALTHAIEAVLSRNAFARTTPRALDAARDIFRWLPVAVRDGRDLAARQALARASYEAGFAFTQAGVGYVHALSHGFGARYHTPHGLGNAIALPWVLDYSKPACADRMALVARHCGLGAPGDSDDALAERLVAEIRAMNAALGIPTHLAALRREDIPALAAGALREARFTYAVPRYLDQRGCEALLAQMLPPD
ncbi:MAG: iron-containing alcohol dehydrogenase [Deltaproteobacteria bacterium]|nr:MAG: iron-containing alcohol dehydrogenase [Deltaproteobacteria bacterium]